jgi:hypothetical protein
LKASKQISGASNAQAVRSARCPGAARVSLENHPAPEVVCVLVAPMPAKTSRDQFQ